MALLQAKHLTKQYGQRQVVKDVSLSVKSGEVVGLLGPNGAGKTTCFYMVIGLVPVGGGSVTLDQLDLTHSPMHERAQKGISYLPQEASVFRKLTVQQNIEAILELRKDLSQDQRNQRLEYLLDEFHLTGITSTLGMSLSGGERRRVEIARALAIEPQFILLDEPFAGVDPISVMDIRKQIHDLSQRGIGVLITDHNVRETLSICHRATIISSGEVIAEGAPHTILSNQKVREVYLGEEFKL